MRVARIEIENFRGIKQAKLLFPKHGVLIGDNNTGKTTILEALDLVLGPDRLNRQPAIDEHDFFILYQSFEKCMRHLVSSPILLRTTPASLGTPASLVRVFGARRFEDNHAQGG